MVYCAVLGALSATEYLAYHDNEWGRPVTSVQGLWMTLEAFQSGLSWITVLRKRRTFDEPSPDLIRGGSPPSPRMTSRDCCVIRASSETAPNHGSHRKRPDSGMAGIDGLSAGDAVTAEQMGALFGAGMHPIATQRLEQLDAADLTDANVQAATALGAPFKVYVSDVSPFRVEVAKRIATRRGAAGQLGRFCCSSGAGPYAGPPWSIISVTG
jgi:hypothetical protein